MAAMRQMANRAMAALPALAIAASIGLGAGAVRAQAPVAIVPNEVIYPGQTISAQLLREVEVTNPNIRPDYVSRIDAVAGAVARKTLLPGHVIPESAVREAYAVERGDEVKLVFSSGSLVITAAGTPLESAAIGDFIRVRNAESGVTVSGTVLADGSVKVVTQ